MASAKSKVDGKRQKTGGRAKGVKNKATKEVIERLKELNCDPIEGMAKIAMNDCPCVSCDETGFITIDISKPEEKEACPDCNGLGKLTVSLELRSQMYKELAQYVAPKRKAVEISGNNGEDIKTQTQVTFVGIATD